MLESLDGKISTGSIDQRDIDKNFPKIKGVMEGLKQYYELEMKTDFWSLNTGRVMEKIGTNNKNDEPKKIDFLRFVIIDNKPHLKEKGITYLSKKLKDLYVVTINKKHPATKLSHLGNVHVIKYNKEIDFTDLFEKLNRDYGAERVTIQSGGTLNSVLLRKGLIDEISLIVAPVLVGGKDTPTLIDGNSLKSDKDLSKIKALKLKNCQRLNDSYLHLTYEVLK